MDSTKFTLNKADLWKTTRGLLIVMGAAGLTYLSEHLGDFNLGSWNAVIIPIASSLIELGRRWFAGQKEAA